MNTKLETLAHQLGLNKPESERLRLAFGLACVLRVQHLLEAPRASACVAGLGAYLDGSIDRAAFDQLTAEAARLANQHPGSGSLDGCGHAAVSATYAVAKALAGRALDAADYAAYAIVYAQGGAGAVAERSSFDAEFAWQEARLAALAEAPHTGG